MIYLSGKVVPGRPAMVTPLHPNVPRGVWAADTGCFSRPDRYTDDGYLAWLASRDRSTCLFATAPDRFGDGETTLKLAVPMLPRIRELGIPAAFVVQPGVTVETVPWDLLDVIFVGGPNPWQHGEEVARIVAEAHRLGKRVHVGRVNGWKRFSWAFEIGAASCDGTYLAYGMDQNLPRLERWEARIARQPSLGLLGDPGYETTPG